MFSAPKTEIGITWHILAYFGILWHENGVVKSINGVVKIKESLHVTGVVLKCINLHNKKE